MKIRFLTLKNFLITAFAGLAGINLGCHRDIYLAEEYGCPIDTYHVVGTVTDTAGNPIEGVDVGMCGSMTEDDYLHDIEYTYSSHDTTGADGRYEHNIFDEQGVMVVQIGRAHV